MKEFLFIRPTWFRHEGWWRLVQVVRLGPPFALLVLGVGIIGLHLLGSNDYEWLTEVAICFIGAPVVLTIAHVALKLICWIFDGFLAEKKTV